MNDLISWALGGTSSEWWSGTWASVVLPLLLTAYAFLVHRDQWRPRLWLAIAMCLAASALTAYWKQTDESVSLHIIPVFLLAMAFAGYLRSSIPASVCAAACFLTLVGTDLIHAVLRFGSASPDLSYLWGIGGAGIGDGLFIFPFLALLMQVYVRWRLKPTV